MWWRDVDRNVVLRRRYLAKFMFKDRSELAHVSNFHRLRIAYLNRADMYVDILGPSSCCK